MCRSGALWGPLGGRDSAQFCEQLGADRPLYIMPPVGVYLPNGVREALSVRACLELAYGASEGTPETILEGRL